MLNLIILSVIMLSFVMLSVIMLNVVMLSVAVPYSDVNSYLHSAEVKALYYFTALVLASLPLLPPIISNEQNLSLDLVLGHVS
jgi:hypothetical protein